MPDCWVSWLLPTEQLRWMLCPKLAISFLKSYVEVLLSFEPICPCSVNWLIGVCHSFLLEQYLIYFTYFFSLKDQEKKRTSGILYHISLHQKKQDNPIIQKSVRHLGQAERSPSEQQSALNQTSSQPSLLNYELNQYIYLILG